MRNVKLDTMYIGLITGLSLPFLILVGIYLIRGAEDSFTGFLYLTFRAAILTKLISLAAIPNALVFFVFIWTGNLRSARGVIFSLLVLCLVVILIKYVPW